MTQRMDISSGAVPVAIIVNEIPPYRIHLHRRIICEIPEIRVWTICTHDAGRGLWRSEVPADIHPILLGQGQPAAVQQRKIRYWPREWRKAGRIIRWMKQQRIRAVIMGGYNDLGRLRLIHWCRRHQVNCFLVADSNIHSDKARGLVAMIKRLWVSSVVRKCDGILPCGTLGKAYFERYGADPDRIFFFPYEPDYELIRNLPSDVIENTRRRFQLNPNRRRIVFCARMVDVKRPDLLIDAFIRIADERSQWDLVMAGSGPMEEYLKQRLPAELRERVIWTGFLDDQSAVSALYRLSDVLVLPSDYEPWALVINEAVAAGMAVVASNIVGAAAELVREGVNGHTFPVGDLNELTDCLREVTDDKRIDAMKAASKPILEDWQQHNDPVKGLRRALRAVGIFQ